MVTNIGISPKMSDPKIFFLFTKNFQPGNSISLKLVAWWKHFSIVSCTLLFPFANWHRNSQYVQLQAPPPPWELTARTRQRKHKGVTLATLWMKRRDHHTTDTDITHWGCNDESTENGLLKVLAVNSTIHSLHRAIMMSLEPRAVQKSLWGLTLPLLTVTD